MEETIYTSNITYLFISEKYLYDNISSTIEYILLLILHKAILILTYFINNICIIIST